jgi:hypothetical protein
LLPAAAVSSSIMDLSAVSRRSGRGAMALMRTEFAPQVMTMGDGREPATPHGPIACTGSGGFGAVRDVFEDRSAHCNSVDLIALLRFQDA